MDELQIYYIENSESRGPFSVQEIRQSLQTGKITSATLGWHKRLTQWQPIGVILHDLRDLSFAPAVPPPATGMLQAPEAFPKETLKHSGLGITASVIGGVTLIGWIASVTAATMGVMQGLAEDSGMMVGAGLSMILFFLLNLIGIVVAAIAVFDASKKKGFSIFGLVFNGVQFVGMLALVVLGMMTQ